MIRVSELFYIVEVDEYLGYQYCEYKRSYYTDGHEHNEVIEDRND